jgi:hypothetical protein
LTFLLPMVYIGVKSLRGMFPGLSNGPIPELLGRGMKVFSYDGADPQGFRPPTFVMAVDDLVKISTSNSEVLGDLGGRLIDFPETVGNQGSLLNHSLNNKI